MEEKVNQTLGGQPEPQGENLPPENADTIQHQGKTESAFVEVKFNKETKKLTLDEAATLAQKGMKFDMISGDFSRLKSIAEADGLTVKEYINRLDAEINEKKVCELAEKCGGDKELAQRVLNAEKGNRPDKDAQFSAEFPDLDVESLPEEVKTAAEIKGTGLLFEYLLYEHRKRVAAAEENLRREKAEQSSLGSLSCGTNTNAADAEFLKGVWGR